nr:thermonuclease family protein [Sphingobium yanoikuyae]
MAFVSAQVASQTFDAQGRAIDGDTVAVDFRLLGVDAFERRQLCRNTAGCWECGKAAQDFAADALRSKAATISLKSNRSYGRPVATIIIDGQDLGERMIRAGLAVPEVQYLRDEPGRARRYASAFAQAKAARAGAFSGSWIEPSRWRRGDRLRCGR